MGFAKMLFNMTLLLVATMVSTMAFSQSFPNRPLTMMIGFNPGGSTDLQARVLAPILADILGQPVNIIHMPGAGGSVSAAMLANSKEGGYVFQYGLSTPFVLSPLVTKSSYDVTSFRYVAGVTLDQLAFVTGGNSPFSDWEGFIAYAKQSPDLVYATQNQFDRLVINRIAKKEGISLRIVPTTGGAGMAPLVLSGDALLAFSGGTHSVYTEKAQMRVLASLTSSRLAYYPSAPTLKELGYDLSMDAIRVAAVPSNTSDEEVAVLAAAFEKATQHPRFIAVTEKTIKMPVVFMDELTLNDLFSRQVTKYQRLLTEAN